MRSITFGTFFPAERERERRSDSVEPRLFAESDSWPVEEPAIADQEAPLFQAEAATEEHMAAAPTIPPPDGRLTQVAAGFPSATLFYSALVGLVAILIVGAFCGVGFLLLTPPGKAPADKGTSAAVEPISPHPAPIGTASALAVAKPAPTISQPPPTASPAAGPPPHPAAAALTLAPSEAASPRPVEPMQTAPPSPAAVEPPTPTVPVPGQKPPVPVAAAGPQPAAHGVVRHAAASAPKHYRRLADRRREPRHWHVRTMRFGHSPEPPRPRFARPAPPVQDGQAQRFDQLLTQLTGPAKPAGQASAPPALTPPAAGAPNPFPPDAGSR